MKALWAMLVLIPSVCGCGGSPAPETCTYWSYGPGGTDGQLAQGIRQPDGGCRPEGFTAYVANGTQAETQDGMRLPPQVAWTQVMAYRQVYEAKWGPVDLTGWRFRFVDGEAIPGHNSTTDWGNQLVTIGKGGAEWIPHELRHVQLGPSSADHHGWCLDYEPWELATLGLDESAYLGCHS